MLRTLTISEKPSPSLPVGVERTARSISAVEAKVPQKPSMLAHIRACSSEP